MRGKDLPLFRRRPHILCLDESNSDRSQMAEGYLRSLAGAFVEVQSAGIRRQPLDGLAVQAMREDGVDIHAQQAKLATRELLLWADVIITISGGPMEPVQPPIPASAKEKRWLILAPHRDAPDELEAMRRTRDDVKRRVQQFVNALRLFRGNAR